WMPQSFSQVEMIEKIVEDNQGNVAQLWMPARGYAASTHAEWQYGPDEIGINVPQPASAQGTNLKVGEGAQIQAHPERNGAGVLRFIREAAQRGVYTMLIYAWANDEWAKQFQDFGKYYMGYDFGERYTFRLDESTIAGKKLEDVTLRMLADD